MVYLVQLKREDQVGGPTVNLYVLVCAILSFPLILYSYRNAFLFVLMVL